MFSNYNVLTISRATKTYKAGDLFVLSDEFKRVCESKLLKFDGFIIEYVDYDGFGGTRLHFNNEDLKIRFAVIQSGQHCRLNIT